MFLSNKTTILYYICYSCCCVYVQMVKWLLYFFYTRGLASWRTVNGVGRINKVTLRRARLVLGWVTCPASTPGVGTLFRYVTSHPGRRSLSSFRDR